MTDTPQGEVAATRRRRRWPIVLPWTLAVVAMAAAVWSTLQWRTLADDRARVDSARAAAVAFARELTNWDATDGLDDEVAALRQRGTGPFLDEITFVFGGDELANQLEANGISATGTVEEVFVQDVAGDTAEVFTVVSVTYASPDTQEAAEPVTFPATLVLERDAEDWLVREVTVPNSSEIGRLMGSPDAGAPTPEETEG